MEGNKKILILRTSLVSQEEVLCMKVLLDKNTFIDKWSIDMEDCDKVLRIECRGLDESGVIRLLHSIGVEAGIL